MSEILRDNEAGVSIFTQDAQTMLRAVVGPQDIIIQRRYYCLQADAKVDGSLSFAFTVNCEYYLNYCCHLI